MIEYYADEIDVAIIGAGHAGVEAALACARLGLKTMLFTLSLDGVANMPCNPSIGGTAKGHLVREIDALGGEMGKVADQTFIQSRMLNRGKGPAVHSLRVQADRYLYAQTMRQVLENQPNLDLKQAEIVDIKLSEQGAVSGVLTSLGAVYLAKAVIICSGTYLNSKIFVGEYTQLSGPDGMHAATFLSDHLAEKNITLRRFKTGTPARAKKESIDFSVLEVQQGDTPITPFSFETDYHTLENKVDCHIAYTNEKTHQIILDNMHRSPLYGGEIEGVGPRYCPSIEDKIMRFADKPRHQIFIEPMGLTTNEMYLQGLSSSLPEEVQIEMYRSIKGLESVKIMRNAYAIEYDCIDPTILLPTLEFKAISNLYGAGQFNGTSGYEEAAAQGLIAGINAARKIKNLPPLILDRASSYIGTLIDDLVIKGCTDPYRMMTSRSEYRLILRQDNADTRLTPIGYEIGLISEERFQKFEQKKAQKELEIKRLSKTNLSPSDELNELLISRETVPLSTGIKLYDLMKRPQISYEDLKAFDPERPLNLGIDVIEQVEVEIKYEGYIKKQLAQVEQMRRLETMPIPKEINYQQLKGLRLEAVDKLEKIRPVNIGQASRISGVNPADISVLIILLESLRNQKIGKE